MLRKFKLATAIAVALSTVVTMGSAEAHIGGRGGSRIGGGLIPRARQGNGIRNGGNNGVVGGAAPAPRPAAAPPIVQIGGTNSSKPPVPSSSTPTNKPSTGTVVSSSATKNTPPKSTTNQVPSPNVQAPAPVHAPVPGKSNANFPGHLVFNLTGNATEVDPNATDIPAVKPTGLSSETKQALAEALADSALPGLPGAPAAENAPPVVASKEVPLPQMPVGATVTLNGKDLTDKEGQVVLQIGDIALPATITEWKNDRVTCTLPVLGLGKSSKATLHVLKADGKTASMLNCELVTALPTAADAKR